MGDLSEDAADDLEGLDASAAHVANLLSTEPADSRFLLKLYSTFYFLITSFNAFLLGKLFCQRLVLWH